MALEELKIPKERPGIKDQIPLSRFKYGSPRKYTTIMSGIDIDSNYIQPVPKTISRAQLENQENDYIENTYIDDYFQ